MTENLKYENKDFPISVAYYALKHTSRELTAEGQEDLSIDQILSGNLESYEPLLWYSLVAGHKKEGKELTIQREDMEMMLDDVLWQFIALIPKFFPTGNVLKETHKMSVPPKKK
jgi:hypothetical protein